MDLGEELLLAALRRQSHQRGPLSPMCEGAAHFMAAFRIDCAEMTEAELRHGSGLPSGFIPR